MLTKAKTRSLKGQKPSVREVELVRLICSGHSSRAAAELMKISIKTADTHRARVMQKLGFDNVVKLTHWAIANGIVEVMSFQPEPDV
jgi:DNA-binding CsgD family transcriptional regulator